MTHNQYVERCTVLQHTREFHYNSLMRTAGVRREVHRLAMEAASLEEANLSRMRSTGRIPDDSTLWEEQCAIFDGREHMVF